MTTPTSFKKHARPTDERNKIRVNKIWTQEKKMFFQKKKN